MLRSTSCNGRARTWKWRKSQHLWKARARQPHAPARPNGCTTEQGRPPLTPSCATHFPGSPPAAPLSRPQPRSSQLGLPTSVPCPLQDQARPPERTGPLARAPGHPPAPPRRRDPQGPGAGPRGHPEPLYRAAFVPQPPLPAPEARNGVHTFLRTQEVTAVKGVHLVQLRPATPDDPQGPRALRAASDWELWRSAWAEWLACLPPQCRWMTTGP